VVAWAASNGDRSENADYQYGKRRLREIDRRIRFLTKRIDAAEVVDPEAPRRGRAATQVFFGATVRYANAGGEERVVSVVGIDEVRADEGAVEARPGLDGPALGSLRSEGAGPRGPGDGLVVLQELGRGPRPEDEQVVERRRSKRTDVSRRRRVARGLPPERQPGEGQRGEFDDERDEDHDDRFNAEDVR